ncbi:MAG: M3 family oligoendopeptidase [Lachnospiraceae bacterium]
MKQYKFSQLPYKPNDFDSIQEKIAEDTERIRTAASPEEVLEIIKQHDEMMDDADQASTIAYIRSSLDCTDAFYAEAVQKEGAGMASLKTAPYYRALLESPFLPQLEKRFGTEYRARLEKEFRINAAGHELMAREQELINLYQQKKAMLQIEFQGKKRSEGEMYAFFDSQDRQTRISSRKATAETVLAQKDEFAPMLLELISLRNQIAEANGFVNYLEYANAGFERRGYGEAELTAFCEQVKTDLVPLLQILQEEQRKELGVERLMVYDLGVRFADGNAVPAGDAVFLTEASKKMYRNFSPEFGAFFEGMVESESLDVSASPHKVAGMGFCTDLMKEDYYPYVFGNCNGTDTDVAVFTHEIGHAWQGYLTAQHTETSLLRNMALDAVEIPSKTMELFTYTYAEEFFGKDAEKFRQGHFRAALQQIASYCAVHEFNTWIYTHPGASFEELVSVQREISGQYTPDLDYGELDDYNRQGADLMRNMAVYMFPRYVISYSLSEMCAMELFERMQENPQAAWESYEKLCASGGSRSYPDTLLQAGLQPAYAEGSVAKTVTFAKKYLKL